MTTLHRSAHGTAHTERDLALAWVATAVVVALVALMPQVPALVGAFGLDLEEAGFAASLAVFVGFVVLVDAVAAVAIVLARRVVDAGRAVGRVPLVVSAMAAGLVTALMLLAAVGHLLGME